MRTDYATIPNDEKLRILNERLYQAEKSHFAIEIGMGTGPGMDPDEDSRRKGQLEAHIDELHAAIASLGGKPGGDTQPVAHGRV